MKTHFLSSRILYLFVIATFLTSCEKVIELDLDTQEKELVVDGSTGKKVLKDENRKSIYTLPNLIMSKDKQKMLLVPLYL